MTPAMRKWTYERCLRAAVEVLRYAHSPVWGVISARAFEEARAALSEARDYLATATPDVPASAILRSEVEGVALSLAVMAADALHPDRPTPTDEALMGVVATLRRALAEIAKEMT